MAGARVTGDITAPAIAMDVGAICEGQIHMQDQVQLTNFEDRRAAS
jgi:cytoskeletal protein CcmA (bactofilin family)